MFGGKKKPVYIINGFLDSGKTDFFRYTMLQPYFKTNGLTLIIACEEGENEYGEGFLKKTNSALELIESRDEFTVDKLAALDDWHDPERVLIEWNGMWSFRDIKLPEAWSLEQQITAIDAQTFPMYFNNMKSLLSDQLRGSDLIIFNRADGIESLPDYKRNVKAVNQKADIIFEGENGEIDVTLDEDLPYDLNDDPIVLNNYGFGNFYLDALEHVDRYLDKRVKFKGMVMKPGGIPEGCFVPGRMVMTCCAQDIQVLGFACEWGGVPELKEQDWVEITARVDKKYVEAYEGEGPYLMAESVETAKPPESEIIDFSNPDE